MATEFRVGFNGYEPLVSYPTNGVTSHFSTNSCAFAGALANRHTNPNQSQRYLPRIVPPCTFSDQPSAPITVRLLSCVGMQSRLARILPSSVGIALCWRGLCRLRCFFAGFCFCRLPVRLSCSVSYYAARSAKPCGSQDPGNRRAWEVTVPRFPRLLEAIFPYHLRLYLPHRRTRQIRRVLLFRSDVLHSRGIEQRNG